MKTITVRKAINRSKKKIYFEPLDNLEVDTSEAFDSWFYAELFDQ